MLEFAFMVTPLIVVTNLVADPKLNNVAGQIYFSICFQVSKHHWNQIETYL
ncbi:hypothetical protein MPL1032_180178 [Mesorhizobium plurifarium]|uniref:Uncharacterized protein n=1 Tax=Mesorhizobium plurifarium TaxID=69974 RepID=A0A0K2VTP4_MESPL|nr:hypothetical protein MPL1032_180178 [Mesorhizobium plurifarium]